MWNCSTSCSQNLVEIWGEYYFYITFSFFTKYFFLYSFVLFQSLYVSNYWGVTGPCFWNKTTCFDSVELFYMHSTSSFLIVHIFFGSPILLRCDKKKNYIGGCVIWGVEATTKSKSLVVWVKDMIALTEVQVGAAIDTLYFSLFLNKKDNFFWLVTN